MLSPLYDVFRMAQAAKTTEMRSPVGVPAGSFAAQTQAATLQADEGLQARTQLNFLLTSGVIAALHFMRLLGITLGECNRLSSLQEEKKVRFADEARAANVRDTSEVVQAGGGAKEGGAVHETMPVQVGLKEE